MVIEREKSGKNIIIQKIIDRIQLAKNTNAFENVRINSDNQEMFVIFVSYCLVNFTISVNWHHKAYINYNFKYVYRNR